MAERTIVEHRSVRLGSARLTRAHLALSASKRTAQTFVAVTGRVAQTLSKELCKPVTIQARLLPAACRGREAVADPAAFALLDLGALGAAALLEVETPIAGAFVDALAGGPAAISAPYSMSPAERAALGFLCLVGIRSVREDPALDKALAPRFVRTLDSSAEASALASALGPQLVVELKLKIGTAEGLARLLVPAAPIAALCLSQPAEPRRSVALRAEIPAIVKGPTIALDDAELGGLNAGDVIVLAGARLFESRYQGAATIFAPSFHLEGGFGPKGFTVNLARTAALLEEAMPEKKPPVPVAPKPAAVPPAPPKPPIPLPIEIEVELARIRIPVQDLANVEIGAVLPLHVTSNDSVVLRIGDKVVARAELVDVEGELGARIVSMEA